MGLQAHSPTLGCDNTLEDESQLVSVFGAPWQRAGVPGGYYILLAAHFQMPFALNPRSYHFSLAKLSTTEASLSGRE